jgi:hypothetical protein
MKKTLIAALVGLALIASACSIDVEANPDGSLTVTSNVTEQKLQAAIDSTIKDPNVESLDVEFRDGFVAVDGTGRDQNTGRINETSFVAELSVDDGHLDVDISDAVWNSEPVPLWIVELWNESLARNLEREGRKNPDATLTSVTVTDADITMVWHVETEASKR